MPGADAILASGNRVDREGAGLGRLRKIWVIEHHDPRVRPGMLLAHHFDLHRLLQAIDRHHLSIVVEWRDGGDLARADVDQPVGVKRAIIVADVESARGRHHLHEWIENAPIVGQIEPSLHREAFSGTDIRKPDDRAGDLRARHRQVVGGDAVAANVDVAGRSDDLWCGWRAVKIDRAGDGAAGGDCHDFIGLGHWRDDRRPRGHAVTISRRVLTRMGRSGVVAGTGNGRGEKYREAEKSAEHLYGAEVISHDQRASDVPRLFRLIDRLSSNPRGNYSGAEDFRVSHSHDVTIQHHEVGVFPGGE